MPPSSRSDAAPRHDALFELEIGDAVKQEAADAVIAVVDVDLIAAAAQLLGGGQAARSGADDADRTLKLARRAGCLDPSLLEGGLGDVLLDPRRW